MLFPFYILSVVFISSTFCVGHGSESHLICKQVSEVFDTPEGIERPNGQMQSPHHRIQGVPGKQGVTGSPGARGLQGPIGPPGVVDYARVTSMVNNSMTPVTARLISRIEEMEAKLERMAENLKNISAIQDITPRLPEICTIDHQGKCMWSIVHATTDVDFSEAERLCSQQLNGVPANIYSEQNYNDIMAHMRRQMPSVHTYYYLWTGLRTNPSTGVLTLSDGTKAPALKWYPGKPSTSAATTHTLILVRSDPSHKNQGMHNYNPSHDAYGVICEAN